MLLRDQTFRRLCLARDVELSPSHLTRPVTIAVFSDTYGNLIQIYQPA